MNNIKQLLSITNNFTWQEILEYLSGKNTIFSTSFSLEDQIIIDYIARKNLNIKVFTLDTGRLFENTYKVWQDTLDKYKIKIKVFYPHQENLKKFVDKNGINSFYNSIEYRKKCCFLRKVEPLKEALRNKKYWISGIRAEHSINRKNKEKFEYDNNSKIIKSYPLLEKSEKEIWDIIKDRKIIYNELYDKGYRSIGCSPCTRATKKGENIRAGRWWWEEGKKECGLHLKNGKLVKKINN